MIAVILIVELVLAALVAFLLMRTQQNNKISVQESMDLANLPIVTFNNNGHKLHFVLDTGSSESLINSEILEKCEFRKTDDKRENVGIDGIRHKREMVELKLKYRKKTFTEKFMVSDSPEAFKYMKQTFGITIHGLIGNTFFLNYGYVLDFADMTVYTK